MPSITPSPIGEMKQEIPSGTAGFSWQKVTQAKFSEDKFLIGTINCKPQQNLQLKLSSFLLTASGAVGDPLEVITARLLVGAVALGPGTHVELFASVGTRLLHRPQHARLLVPPAGRRWRGA